VARSQATPPVCGCQAEDPFASPTLPGAVNGHLPVTGAGLPKIHQCPLGPRIHPGLRGRSPAARRSRRWRRGIRRPALRGRAAGWRSAGHAL